VALVCTIIVLSLLVPSLAAVTVPATTTITKHSTSTVSKVSASTTTATQRIAVTTVTTTATEVISTFAKTASTSTVTTELATVTTLPTISIYSPKLKTGIIIPLYSYPGSTWSAVMQERRLNPNVPMVVVINPNDGPSTWRDENFVQGIKNLQSLGIKVLGYVYTSFGSRSIDSIEADVQSYADWYHVNGIFFDEMASTQGYETYYSNLNSYVKSVGLKYTVGNPGPAVPTSFIGTLDSIVIYENWGLPNASSISRLYSNYNSSNFAIISYGVSQLDQAFLKMISDSVGYVYFTNSSGLKVYSTLPSYFGSEVSMLNIPITQQLTPILFWRRFLESAS
jgi:hypothetical protein